MYFKAHVHVSLYHFTPSIATEVHPQGQHTYNYVHLVSVINKQTVIYVF